MSDVKKPTSDSLIGQQLTETIVHIDTIKKNTKNKGKTFELLDALSKDLTDAKSNIIKAFKKGEQSDKLSKELQKITKLLNSLDKNPEMQLKESELIVFWQTIHELIGYTDPVDRASVKRKQFRVKSVSNDQLDSR